jgi:hypothetical protein
MLNFIKKESSIKARIAVGSPVSFLMLTPSIMDNNVSSSTYQEFEQKSKIYI